MEKFQAEMTLADYQADLRKPTLDAEQREAYDKLPKEYRERAEEQIREQRLQPLFDLVYTLINSMGAADAKMFAIMLARKLHRTLVQEFVRSVIIPFLQELKRQGDEGFVDPRNQGSYEFAKAALEATDKTFLPFI